MGERQEEGGTRPAQNIIKTSRLKEEGGGGGRIQVADDRRICWKRGEGQTRSMGRETKLGVGNEGIKGKTVRLPRAVKNLEVGLQKMRGEQQEVEVGVQEERKRPVGEQEEDSAPK